jgi:peptide/nickel transport system ATP-binding protein
MMPVAALGLATGAAARSLVEEALDAVGLDPGRTLGRRPRQLSAGQLQRVTLARALLVKPRLIVADEPVSMVDASLRASILGTIRRLHRERGISFLYITHDLATAFHVCERLLVMYRGCVVESGDVRTVIRDPRHPYTRSLVDAVPSPDPARPWGAAVRAPRPAGDLAAGPGCPYLVACDRAGPECVDERPALTVVQDGHEVACARAGVRAG